MMPVELGNEKRRNYKRPLFELPSLDARRLARHGMFPKDWGAASIPISTGRTQVSPASSSLHAPLKSILATAAHNNLSQYIGKVFAPCAKERFDLYSAVHAAVTIPSNCIAVSSAHIVLRVGAIYGA